MHLTQKQESLISQYLRDASRRLDGSLPERTRERSLRQIQTRIYHDLESLNRPSISDEDVLRVLRQLTTPAPAAPTASAAPAVPPAGGAREATLPAASAADRARNRFEAPKPVWLGVCASNAERFGAETWMLRLALVLLGLLTGPVAIFIYIAAFAEYYYTLSERERPAIDWPRLAVRAAAPVVVLIAMRWGTNQLLELIAYGHERVFKEPMPSLGEWDWFRFHEGSVFFFAFITVLPISVLSGLPLANAWGHSLKRLAQAIAALYGVLLCFGLASVIAGLILDRVQTYMQ